MYSIEIDFEHIYYSLQKIKVVNKIFENENHPGVHSN